MEINVHLSDTLIDRLHILAVEYSVPTDVLVNAAIKHFIDGIDLARNLRTGKIELD